MEPIYTIDKLSELEKAVKLIDEKVLRKELTSQYFRLVEYTNAEEWNRLVRICEIFSIIGWGNLERVNANCCKSLNQWHTELENKNRESRFLKGNWVKRKNGYVLFNPSYHYSPDKPDNPSIDWENYPKQAEIECAVQSLSVQRNKQKMNPIVFGGIYTHNTKVESKMLFPMLRDLRKLFDYNLKPELYGYGITNIAVRYITAQRGEKRTTCFERGTYYPKKERYECEIFIGEEFAEMSENERKKQIKCIMQEVLETLKEKLKKSKQKYNIDLLTTDTMCEIDKWIKEQRDASA